MFRSTTTLASLIASAALLTSGSAALAGTSKPIASPKTTKASTIAKKSDRRAIESKSRADVNGDGRVSTQDMYDFLDAWNVRMEKGVGSMQEYYDFLEAFHAATAPASGK